MPPAFCLFPLFIYNCFMMKAAVFTDRDGTLCEEADYLGDPEKVRLIPGAARGVAALNRMRVPVIIVSNQAGVARGYFSEKDVALVNERLIELLGAEGAGIDGIYTCPHHAEAGIGEYRVDCECRKPNPGMLHRAAADMDINLAASFIVGDKDSDIELAPRAGCRASVLVLTGYGAEHLETLRRRGAPPSHVSENFADAADWILDQLFPGK